MAAVLELEGLSKHFGGLPAVNGVSLRVDAGERRLLLGPNGAGKTTLFNLITGELPRDAGRIRLFGREVARPRPERCVQLGVARTYQVITLFPRDTFAHNVVLALLGVSRLRWRPLGRLARRRDLAERARHVLHQVGLAELAERRVAEAAYGEQRRLELAMALAQAPRLLLLDEPLAGLSREERRAMQTLVAAIPRTITILMIEHDMDIALELAERITVLHYGQTIAEGTRTEIVGHPRVREVYLGG
jgi:branched-chain amino acid transport system ATP-binding protein